MSNNIRQLVHVAVTGIVAGLGVYALLIRPWHLRWGAAEEEIHREFPGDDLVGKPWLRATRAITIEAPPTAVWPWLVQMGYRRAGWYSYDRLDNDGVHVHRVIPELQHLKVGDTLLTGQNSGFSVRELEPHQHMVLFIDDPKIQISSALILEPLGQKQTRLIIRLHAHFRLAPFPFLFATIFDFGDFIMMRKMMLGIKQRAEMGDAVIFGQ